jgi:hypothetical protein
VKESEYERISSLRPGLAGHFLFWIFLILYCISFFFALIKSWELEPLLVQALHDRENDLVFPLYGNGIFAICVLFLYLPIGFVVISLPFRILPGFVDAYRWYDLRSSKTADFDSYSRKSRRNMILVLVTSVLALFFLVQSVGLHLRAGEAGISYQRFFSLAEEEIGWPQLREVRVYPEMTESRKSGKNLSPKMYLVLPGEEVDVWQGAGLGSPSANDLIRFIGMVQRHSTARISVTNQFDSDMRDQLDNHSDTWKRDNITKTFDYLRQVVTD